MIYPRKILKNIYKYLDIKEMLIITGMRRTGKTTVLKMIFDKLKSSNKIFIDLDNIITQMLFDEKDFDNIWRSFESMGLNRKTKAYIFIDEIQSYPDSIKIIKYLYDHYNIKFIITGSSSFYLKNLFPESLSGRKILFELYPLDFEEFTWFRDEKKIFYQNFHDKDRKKNELIFEKYSRLYQEYLEFGGFPQVVLAETRELKEYYIKDIFNSYFEKEIRLLGDFKNLATFRNLLFLLMIRTGSKIEYSKIAVELKTSRDTVYSYINFLQSTYFIFLISPYTRNVDREVSGAKKIYFCDNGILNTLSHISQGALFENSVFLNLMKYGSAMYYQKRAGSEVDFILKDINTAIEVKSTANYIDLKKLSKYSGSLGLPNYYIITRNFSNEKKFIPATEV